jgi:hypothetical protein
MKDVTEEQWRAERPQGVEADAAIEYCLKMLFENTRKRSQDVIIPGLTFETLIGTLLLAQDVVTEHEDCYYE